MGNAGAVGARGAMEEEVFFADQIFRSTQPLSPSPRNMFFLRYNRENTSPKLPMAITPSERAYYDSAVRAAENLFYNTCAWCGKHVANVNTTLTLATHGPAVRETVLFCDQGCRDQALEYFPADSLFS